MLLILWLALFLFARLSAHVSVLVDGVRRVGGGGFENGHNKIYSG